MDDKRLRDKQDRDLTPDQEQKGGCPTCGTKDIQSAELLLAWKEIEDITAKFEKGFRTIVDPKKSPDDVAVHENIDWKGRYEQIKTAYVKTRLEVSGSFGNWDYNTRKRVLEHEISTELGFTV